MIAVLNYGMGNLRSVEKALERVGAEAELTSDPARIKAASGIVLPGVGAFPRAMEKVEELGFRELLHDRSEAGVPVLGICLGLQLLFEHSEELGGGTGLGLLAGDVAKLDAGDLKMPHIGWSPVKWRRDSALTTGIASGTPFYFVHTFAPRPASEPDVLGTAEYGTEFCCAAERDGLFGVQFHPEKSSEAGLRMLANFAGVCAELPVAA